MRVLHVVPSLAAARGGPSAVIGALLPALREEGVEVEVLATAAGLDEGEAAHLRSRGSRLGDVPVTVVPIIGSERVELAPALLPALARAVERVDLVHLHTIFTFPLAAAAAAAGRAGVPYVVRPAGTLDETCLRSRSYGWKRLALATWVGAILRRAAALQATSALEHAELVKLVPRERVHQIGLGADALDVPIDGGKPGTRIATLGRVHPMKGLERLIDALHELPGVELAIGGDGEPSYRASLVRRAEARGVAARVRFLGHLDDAGKTACFAGADLLVFPSRHESFGVAIVEAMAAGRAVVVTPTVGLAPEIAAAGAGVVSAPDPAPLAAAIRAFLDDGPARALAAARGRALAGARYTWTVSAAQTAALYAQILEGRVASERKLG